MKTAVQRHLFVSDGTADVYGKARCVHCGTPEGNVRHVLPDVSEQTAEHRRRVGEDEE